MRDADGEHIVLSDGWHHIRLDLAAGSLAMGAPVILHYHLRGLASAEAKVLPLRRFLELARHGRFARSLFPDDRLAARQILALRVHDALVAGASQREIAAVLFGPADAPRADSLRSRVRRLVREARRLAAGGYRSLLSGKSR